MKNNQPSYRVVKEGNKQVIIKIDGTWSTSSPKPSSVHLIDKISTLTPSAVKFDCSELDSWDTSLLTFLFALHFFTLNGNIEFNDEGLPEGARKLIKLATAVPIADENFEDASSLSILDRIGSASIKVKTSTEDLIDFTGKITASFFRLIRGKAIFRSSDLGLFIREAGAQALPIVTIINFLVGLIIAFIGASQLAIFGAEVFVADLVGVSMVRELAPMMTAIIMAGRSGAAYAAQLGTMMVNEEIDALHTFGFDPVDFLVLPRMIAFFLMMPLLILYSDFIGILGGMIVGAGLMEITFPQYIEQTASAISPQTFLLGIIKGTIYGLLVAFAGCFRGMQSGRSSAAVGAATTSAVVTAIMMIIIASALTTILYFVLGV